jgi:uncharacterized protein
MITGLPTPSPQPDLETQPFWDATARGSLVIPRCTACEALVWYPRSFCPQCGSRKTEWLDMCGRGVVYSYTVVRRSRGPLFAEATPYVIGYVELEEGPRVLTNIVGCDPGEVRIGQSVEIVFEPTDNGYALYRFTPVPVGLRRG